MAIKKFEKFSRAEAGRFRDEFDTALAAFSKKYGVKVEMGRITYMDAELSGKVSVTIAGATTRADAELLQKIKSLKLKKTNKFGDELIAFKSRSPKYPFVYRDGATGKQYKTSTTGAQIRFRKAS